MVIGGASAAALVKWMGDEIGWEAITLQPKTSAAPLSPRVVPLSVSDSGTLDVAKSALTCDQRCGKRNAGLATPDACWCWRESKTDWRQSHWERL